MALTVETAIQAIVTRADAVASGSTAEDLVYLAKALEAVSDTTQASDDAVQAVVNKANELSGDATSEDLIYLAKAVQALSINSTIADITAEGNTQVTRVTDEGDTQHSRVKDQGDVQESRVIGEGDTQVGRVAGVIDSKRDWVELVIDVATNDTATLYATHILSASVTLTLPSATEGDWLRVSNRSGSKEAVVAQGGNPIMGVSEDMTVNDESAGFTMTFIGGTQGWIVA